MVVNVSALTTATSVPAPQRLVAAAVAAFAERGYRATTTRDIASRAGMSPAALYVHYPSKEQLLYEISRGGHLGALEVLKAVGDGTPATRLGEMVAAFTTWHAEHHSIARVVQYELAALSPDHLAEVAAIRRKITGMIESALADGVADGSFGVPDLAGTALALMSMSIDVARWFDPARSQSPADLGQLYADLALRMVSA
jgi:AcrR family transcriptional regulator